MPACKAELSWCGYRCSTSELVLPHPNASQTPAPADGFTSACLHHSPEPEASRGAHGSARSQNLMSPQCSCPDNVLGRAIAAGLCLARSRLCVEGV